MLDEMKLKMLQEIIKGGAEIRQLIIENSGYITYNERDEKTPKKNIEPESNATKKDILQYVMRLEPLVKEEYRDTYKGIWGDILELNEVKMCIYDKGKQQDTTFNRNLLAQIIHQVSNTIYLPNTKPVQMVEYLEPEKGKDHPVRQKLGESPEKGIKKAVEQFLNEKL